MKISAILALGVAILPLANGECDWQDVESWEWRLSTYESKNCINQTGSWKGSGFGSRCIDIPKNTNSFIFTVGSVYETSSSISCNVYFKTKGDCSGELAGWPSKGGKKGNVKSKAAGAHIECTEHYWWKREAAAEGQGERKLVRNDDGEWFEELEDGTPIRAGLVENGLGLEGEADED